MLRHVSVFHSSFCDQCFVLSVQLIGDGHWDYLYVVAAVSYVAKYTGGETGS